MRDVRAERWARSEASMLPMQWWLLREDRSDIGRILFSFHITSRGADLAGGDDDDDLEAESQDRRSGCR